MSLKIEVYCCYRCGELGGTELEDEDTCPSCGEENTLMSIQEMGDTLNDLYLKGVWERGMEDQDFEELEFDET